MLDVSRGYYCQFLVNAQRKETHNFEGNVVGIDLGLNAFYTVGTLHATSVHGNVVENPKYLRKSERRLNKRQRRVSRRYEKGKKPQSNIRRQSDGSPNHKARKQLAFAAPQN